MSDPWDAFGTVDDDEKSEDSINHPSPTDPLALHLTQYFVQRYHRTDLSSLRIRVDKVTSGSSELWQASFLRRGFCIVTDEEKTCDVLVSTAATQSADRNEAHPLAESLVVSGGLLALLCESEQIDSQIQCWNTEIWDTRNPTVIKDTDHEKLSTSSSCWVVLSPWAIPIQSQTCPWLPTQYDIYAERQRASEACVHLTAAERDEQERNGSTARPCKLLPESSIQSAVEKLQMYGYCIVPGLLDPQQSQHFGDIALADLHDAAAILKEGEGVDLMEPRNSTQEPASYRELSMREDLRMDLRHGPRLNQWRGEHGCCPWTVKAATDLSSTGPDRFLRGNANILEIVRRTMNPRDPTLSPGNFGRYNFGGSPEGFLDLRTSPVGAIISLPGSADQAIHADTPHLFETFDCLPAHYINVFTPGCAATPAVGQTALVHGSHRLSFTAKHATSMKGWVNYLVRPSLNLGDVLIFDCRVLHFGLANTSSSTGTGPVERPLLYTNMTQHWFDDPKNWDNRHPIFATHGDKLVQE